MTTVRIERASDVQRIREVNRAAFETSAEASLVDLLRERGKLVVSLVAEREGQIIGHIAFSRVYLASNAELHGLGLGPMAVIPSHQRQGIGSQLVRAGLDRCAALGTRFVVVLGHRDYYPRFGFLPASHFRLWCSWPVPEGVFMATELVLGVLASAEGLVSYEIEFNDV